MSLLTRRQMQSLLDNKYPIYNRIVGAYLLGGEVGVRYTLNKLTVEERIQYNEEMANRTREVIEDYQKDVLKRIMGISEPPDSELLRAEKFKLS